MAPKFKDARTGSEIKFIDEGFEGSPYFVATTTIYGGGRMVIRADSWEEAYEAAVDEMDEVDEDDQHYAYGFDTAEELADAVNRAKREEDDLPELVETYQYDSNGQIKDTEYLCLNRVEIKATIETGLRPEHRSNLLTNHSPSGDHVTVRFCEGTS